MVPLRCLVHPSLCTPPVSCLFYPLSLCSCVVRQHPFGERFPEFVYLLEVVFRVNKQTVGEGGRERGRERNTCDNATMKEKENGDSEAWLGGVIPPSSLHVCRQPDTLWRIRIERPCLPSLGAHPCPCSTTHHSLRSNLAPSCASPSAKAESISSERVPPCVLDTEPPPTTHLPVH